MNGMIKAMNIKKPRTSKRLERDMGSSKTPEKNRFWFSSEAKNCYILLGLTLFFSLLMYPNTLASPKLYNLGDIADRDTKASQDFLVEDSDLTEKGREEAIKSVISVYDFDREGADAAVRLKGAFELGRKYAADIEVPSETDKTPEPEKGKLKAGEKDSMEARFFEILDIKPQSDLFERLFAISFSERVEEAAILLVTQALGKGIVGNKEMLLNQGRKGIVLHDISTEKEKVVEDLKGFLDVNEAKKFISDSAARLSGLKALPGYMTICLDLSGELIRPNLTFNKRETQLRKDLAQKAVSPFYFKVKKGEMIVREGERITPEHLLKLTEQYKILNSKHMTGRAPAVGILIGFLLFTIYVAGLMNDRSSSSRVRDMLFSALTLLATFLLLIAADIISDEIARGFPFLTTRALLFAVPVASGAMLICIFQGINVAASFSLVISVLSALAAGGQVELFIYFFVTSIVASHGIRYCRERGLFIKTGLKVSLVAVVISLSIEAMSGSLYTVEALIAGISAFAGGVLVGVTAAGLLPLAEMAFGYTTDIKLLELASLDQEPLRTLMVQAPGTYHHSIIVGNMVEASAKAINANPLLARVAAYYHDIGKVGKPRYFIENQIDGLNRHEKLAPSMSSLILISHVKDGVEMARKHKLGRELIDIIRQHHGTSLIYYFYEKAREQAEKKDKKVSAVKEEDFRYPGPKPQTKEAGLVMLADMTEAASRTLVYPTASRVQGMVQKIINRVFSDGQLDECELTLKDLHEIAKSFNKTLTGIFHHRVEYPESVEKALPAKKGLNGSSDKLPAGDSWGKRGEDKEEGGESLKRLGL